MAAMQREKEIYRDESDSTLASLGEDKGLEGGECGFSGTLIALSLGSRTP